MNMIWAIKSICSLENLDAGRKESYIRSALEPGADIDKIFRSAFDEDMEIRYPDNEPGTIASFFGDKT